MTLNFGMDIVNDTKLLIFYISRSKVKGQGQKSEKICLFKPLLTTGGQPVSDRDWVGSGRVPLAACQHFLA